jgi:hypothetical protein
MAKAIGDCINQNTATTGFSATVAGEIVTVKAPDAPHASAPQGASTARAPPAPTPRR